MDYRGILGERLTKARKDRGWKWEDVAARTGGKIGRTALSNYEHGRRMPGATELVLLGQAYELPAAYLMGLIDVQTILATTQEETLVINWRKLPENHRMSYYREIEQLALTFADAPRSAQKPPRKRRDRP